VSSIDHDAPPPGHQFSVSVDRSEAPGERTVRLFKDVSLFVVALGFVMLIAWLCYSTLNSPSATSDEKKWAMSVLSAAAGFIGYLVRK
jgi:hypothetical protein